MGNELTDFARAHAELQTVRLGFTLIKERWYSWNYWAQHQAPFSFDDWLDENNLRSGNVKAKTHYPSADITRDREEGYRYYSAWRGAQFALNEAEKAFDSAFKAAWEARTPDGQPAYSNEQLGRVIGKDKEQLRKFASKKSWYQPRTKKGTQ